MAAYKHENIYRQYWQTRYNHSRTQAQRNDATQHKDSDNEQHRQIDR